MIIMDILAVIWLFLGAGFANAAPVFAKKIPIFKDWKTPLDFGKTFQGKPVFGKNKTWRGLIFGIVVATVTIMLQKLVLKILNTDIVLAGQSFLALPTLILGFALGFGALAGDAIESFFKRQFDIAPGRSWFPFDQIDYIIGAILCTLPVIRFEWIQYLSLFAVGFAVHLIASYIGFLLKLKDSPI